MAVNKTDFLVADTGRDPTPIIWGDCPVADIQENPGRGWHFYDDFKDLPLAPTITTQIGWGAGYKVFGHAAANVVQVHSINSVETGLALSFPTTSSNIYGIFAQAFGQARLSGVAGTDGKLWFEAQLCIVSNAATTQGFFLGLAETDAFTFGAGVPFAATLATPTNSGSMIGFQSLETGPQPINTVVNDRATTLTAIQAGVAGTQPGSFSGTVYTFTKLGFVYDPSKSANCITFYQDGAPFSNFYSATSLLATTNLKANSLGMMLAVVGTGTGGVFLNWWRVAQLYP